MVFVIATSSLRCVDERKIFLQLRESERGGLGSRFFSRSHCQELEGSGQIYEYRISLGVGEIGETGETDGTDKSEE